MTIKPKLKNLLLFLLIAPILLSCSSTNGADVRFPDIQQVVILDGYQELNVPLRYDLEISPDGRFLYTSFGSRYDSTNAEWSNISDGERCIGVPLILSPDGRYLAGKDSSGEISVYDFETHECLMPAPDRATSLNPIASWSPTGDRVVLWQSNLLLSFPDFSELQYSRTLPDFRMSETVMGSGSVLWDADADLPVAQIYNCNSCSDNTSFPQNETVGIQSFPLPGQDGSGMNIPLLDIPSPNYSIDRLFDPSGEYVLVAVRELTERPPEGHELDSTYVSDTVLILIHWRTNQQITLFRYSDYDDLYLVSPLGPFLRWSSDGTTLFVPRTDASPLLLKLQYP